MCWLLSSPLWSGRSRRRSSFFYTHYTFVILICLSFELLSINAQSIPTLEKISYQVIPGFYSDYVPGNGSSITYPDPTFGYSVAFAPDASAMAIGSTPLSGSQDQRKWAGRYEYNSTSKVYDASNSIGGEGYYLGRHVAISASGRGLASVYYDPFTAPNIWVWVYFANFNTGGDLSSCTRQNSKVNIVGGPEMLVVGCDTTLYFLQINSASYNVSAKGVTNGALTGDMAMSQDSGSQLLLGTSTNQVQIRKQAQGQTTRFDVLFNEAAAAPLSSGEYLQAALWSNTFAVADGTDNVLVYRFSSTNGSRNIMANITVSHPIGDIALWNNTLAVVLPSLGELWVYNNLTNGSIPCVKAAVPRSLSPVTVMSVAIAANISSLTIAVGVPSSNASESGVIFILVNPVCNYVPPTTGTTLTPSTVTTATIATTSSTTVTTATTITTATSTTTTTTPPTTTTTGNTKPPSKPCSSNLNSSIGNQATCAANGTWTIDGNVTNNANIVVSSNDNVNIVGDLNLTSSASLVLYPNTTNAMPVSVGGIAQLDGGLIIVIDSRLPNNSILIPIINASAINGSFDNIQVVQTYSGSKCYKTTTQALYTETSASLLITTTKKGSCGKDQGKTAGIAVGVTLAFVIIVVIAVIVGIVLYYKYKGPDRVSAKMQPLAADESKAVI